MLLLKYFTLFPFVYGWNSWNYDVKSSNRLYSKPSLVEDWGVTQESPFREFPQTIESLVDHAFGAIAATIHNKAAMDPNIASNAMSKSIFTNRPVRNKETDKGRIGIEMDGIETLSGERSSSPGQALRRAALMLAGKMSSNESWKSFETAKLTGTRPVVVYFNSIKQALWASTELLYLKKTSYDTVYDNVRIKCVSDGVPSDMIISEEQRRRYGGLSSGFVNATRGIFIIVQPTDYNDESTPPGPAIDSINHFQRIVAQASVQELPIVALSPRFLSNESPFNGMDQSGYQQSAIYGGIEPPKGPSPWILRDFTPPVFCWIANAVSLRNRRTAEESSKVVKGLALCQTNRAEGHLWNIFAAEECYDRSENKRKIGYNYLASTRSASGRPTRSVMIQLLEDFGHTEA